MRAKLGNERGGNDLRRALVRNMKWRPISRRPPSRTSEWLGHIFIFRAVKTVADFRNGIKTGEAQGHQPTWLLPRAVRERMGTLRCGRHTVTTQQCRIHRQPLSRHSFAGCDAVTAGGRQGITRQQFLAFAHVSRWRNQGARPRRRSSARGARARYPAPAVGLPPSYRLANIALHRRW